MLPEAASCVWGQAYISAIAPGTFVAPHVGPTNARLRLHLGLDVPEAPLSHLGMEVGGQAKTWQEGRILAFEDSFEHRVWHWGSATRYILVLDIWHPNLDDARRNALVQQHADHAAKQLYFFHRDRYLKNGQWFNSSAPFLEEAPEQEHGDGID